MGVRVEGGWVEGVRGERGQGGLSVPPKKVRGEEGRGGTGREIICC